MANALRNSMKPAGFKDGTKAHDGEVIKTLIESFQYPRKGPGMMWDAAAAQDARAGRQHPHGHARSRACAYDAAKRLWTITARTDRRRDQDLHGQPRHLLGADPRTGALVRRDARAASTAADKLRYRDFLTVALIVEKPDLFPDNWIYIHEPSVKVGRIQNFRSWSPEMVPNTTQSCLGLEYFCFEGDGLWTVERRRADRARQEGAGQDRPRRPRTTSTTAASCARRRPIRSTTTSYKANVETIRSELAEKYPTLHLVGRNGMHKYNNQDHAMMTAMLTVQNIVAGEQRLRHLERQRGRRVPRGRRLRCREGADERAHGAAPRRRGGVISLIDNISRRSSGPERAYALFRLGCYVSVSAAALLVDLTVYRAALGVFTYAAVGGRVRLPVRMPDALSDLVAARLQRRADQARCRAPKPPVIGQFVAAGITGLIVTSLIVWLVADLGGWHPLAAKAVAVVFSFASVFTVMRVVRARKLPLARRQGLTGRRPPCSSPTIR